jgi:acyl carrier protein
MNEFLQKLAETLEVPNLKADDKLKSFPQWDSLAVLSIIAMVDANYSVNLQAADLGSIDSPEELWTLVQSKKSA